MNKTKLILGIYDCIFKKIMLDKENREYLIRIIHYITGIPLIYLQNIKIENVEHVINHKKDKKMRSDIIVSIKNKVINIEMNKQYYEGLFNKNDGYLNKIASNIYEEGKDYLDLKEVVQINFDNFSIFKGNKEVYKFIYKEETLNIPLRESIIKYHVDIDFIKRKCYNKNVLTLSKLEKILLNISSRDRRSVKRNSRR